MTRGARRAAWIVAALLAHELLAQGLARAGLVARLLSPAGAGAVLAALAALALYALRLGLVFVAPGVVLGWVVTAAIEARRGR